MKKEQVSQKNAIKEYPETSYLIADQVGNCAEKMISEYPGKATAGICPFAVNSGKCLECSFKQESATC